MKHASRSAACPPHTVTAPALLPLPSLHLLQIVLNYASFLQEHKYWEESFRCATLAVLALLRVECCQACQLHAAASALLLRIPRNERRFFCASVPLSVPLCPPHPTLQTPHSLPTPACRAYERGVALFKYPHVRDIWKAYLLHFVGRYGGKKLERARDLFRQAIEEVCVVGAVWGP